MSEPTRIRLNVISEVALEGGNPRPIHMFRPGTFTDMNGRETSFSDADVATIVERFNANRRRKPPITERHDFGRAIGRLQDVWADTNGNLYGLPKWNAEGRALLEEEIYDGFSCELDHDNGGWTLIGGSLTNYPAVGGLEPVTLAAPPLQAAEAPTMPPAETEPVILTAPSAPVPARTDTTPNQPSQGVQSMSDILEPVTLESVALPPISDPALQARVDAYFAQQQAAMQQREREIEARLKADFERRMLETDQRNAIHAFARARTMTDATSPFAIPGTAEELAQLLLETPAGVRGKWQTMLTRITTAGLVSFDEIGSSGEAEEAADRWSILVNAKVAAGFSRVDAIRAVAKEHPDLYDAQSRAAKKGGR
jgi:hypothetical protein